MHILIKWLMEAIDGDPPPKPPSVQDYCIVEQERINLETERDCYRRLLLRQGFTPARLAHQLHVYTRGEEVRSA